MCDNETIYDQRISADTVTSVLIQPMNRNQTYYISVRAENEAGHTNWSHPVTVAGFDTQGINHYIVAKIISIDKLNKTILSYYYHILYHQYYKHD